MSDGPVVDKDSSIRYDHPFEDSFCFPYWIWAGFYVAGAFTTICIHKFAKGPLEKMYKSGSDTGTDVKQILCRALMTTYHCSRIFFIIFSMSLIFDKYGQWYSTANNSDWNQYLGWVMCVLYLPSMKGTGAWLMGNVYIHSGKTGYNNELEITDDPFVFYPMVASAVLDGFLFVLAFFSMFPVLVCGFYIFVPQCFCILFGLLIVWLAVKLVLNIFLTLLTPFRCPCLQGTHEMDQHIDDTVNIYAIMYVFYCIFLLSVIAFANFVNRSHWEKVFLQTMTGRYCGGNEWFGTLTTDNWKIWIIFLTWCLF